MPRVENWGNNVTEFCEQSGEGSSTYDLCNHCADVLNIDPHAYDDDLTPYNGDPQGSKGWAAGCEHPPYADEDYCCAVCGDRLTARDD